MALTKPRRTHETSGVMDSRSITGPFFEVPQCLVERRQCQEVEAVDTFDRREPRLLDSPLDHPQLALDQLEFGQAQQVAGMLDALGSSLPGELVILTQERRQLEHLQVMAEQKLGRVGHDVTPVSRSIYVLAEVRATLACGR